MTTANISFFPGGLSKWKTAAEENAVFVRGVASQASVSPRIRGVFERAATSTPQRLQAWGQRARCLALLELGNVDPGLINQPVY